MGKNALKIKSKNEKKIKYKEKNKNPDCKGKSLSHYQNAHEKE